MALGKDNGLSNNFNAKAVNANLLIAIATSASIALSPPSAAASQVVHDPAPAAIARLQLQAVGRLPGTNRLRLAIGLPLRNRDILTNLLEQIYDPASINYRHYLTPQQFTEKFGPTDQDYQAVISFAKANKLEIAGTHANRVLLDVAGDVADIQRAFHVVLHTYLHPTENREFYAPDAEPSLELDVPLLQIDGLNNYGTVSPMLERLSMPQNTNSTGSGSGPNGVFFGTDFRNAYAPGVTLDGSGQMVGLVEFDGYYKSDITNYEYQAGFPQVHLVNVSVDGAATTPSNSGEVPGDIEMVISMATNLDSIVVFEAADDGTAEPWNDMLNAMASSNQIKQFSCSWRLGTLTSSNEVGDQIFQEMGAQGQSFFKASGDGDAYAYPIQWPCDNPWITTVGGTQLTMNDSAASYSSETVWNSGYTGSVWEGNGDSGYRGSGGGVSTTYSLPDYQQGVSMTQNGGSTAKRNLPDVATVARDIEIIYDDGTTTSGDGTSFASPLWAGFMALVNQKAASAGLPSVGFANPAIYSIGRGTNYTACFHDITTGSNTWSGSPSNYYATAGYDLCTGWGSPNGSPLINALVSELSTFARPTISSATISGGNLTVTGASGVPGASYTLLTSTNLALPTSEWQTNTTGVFSSAGAYSNVIKVDASKSDQFFEIRSP